MTVTHRHDEGPWECTPYCKCTFATADERDAHLDAMASQRKTRKREAVVAKKIVRPANADSIVNVTDLQAVVDAENSQQTYTWKGGAFPWRVYFSREYEPNGNITVSLDTIRHRHGDSSPFEFSARTHSVTGQWLVSTPSGYTVVPTAEEALDRLNADYDKLPPERTVTIAIRNVTVRHGIDDKALAKDVAAHVRQSRYVGTVTMRNATVTHNDE